MAQTKAHHAQKSTKYRMTLLIRALISFTLILTGTLVMAEQSYITLPNGDFALFKINPTGCSIVAQINNRTIALVLTPDSQGGTANLTTINHNVDFTTYTWPLKSNSLAGSILSKLPSTYTMTLELEKTIIDYLTSISNNIDAFENGTHQASSAQGAAQVSNQIDGLAALALNQTPTTTAITPPTVVNLSCSVVP